MSLLNNAFISYGRADSKEFAKKLHDRLAQEGLKVWFDFNDIPLGVDYQNQIDEGIEQADNFLYIIAPHSVNSPYCGKEVDLALKRNKRIIPLLHVEQVSRELWQQRFPGKGDSDWQDYTAKGKHSSFPNMHPEIAKINWVYCREGIDDFEQAFQGLQALLLRQQTYVQQHTFFLSKALEWERQQKQSRYLLVGDDRQQAEVWLKTRFKEEQPPCIPTDLHCEFITESVKNSQNLMTQVFLSYAEEELAIMEQVRRSLRREGFTVWTNKTDIQTGVDFQEAINRGVEEADNLVYLMSPASLQSPYCQQEIDYALSLNKRIIPLLVQPTDLEQIPPTLRNLQYIDLTDNTVEVDYQQDESQLLRALRQDAAYYEEHKVLLTRALKWQRQHQNPSVLLRGYNLQHAEAWLKLAKSRSQHQPLPIQEEFITASLQQPPGISLDVFVSYSRADSDFARKLNDALQVQGKTTWFDQESIASGADFQREIYRGIENANNFLFVISPNAVGSPYCADEVEYAQKLNKRIVTILHRPVNPKELHPVLAAVQWIDFERQDGDFTANFKEVLRTIDTDPVHLQAHTRLLVRAIEWDSKGRNESLLLRGDDLDDAEQWVGDSAKRDPKPTSLQQDYVKSSRSLEAANRQASEILEAAAKKGQQRVLIGTSVMAIGLAVAGIASFFAYQAGEQVKVATLERSGSDALKQFEFEPLRSLVSAVRSGEALKALVKDEQPLSQYPTTSPLLALQTILSQIHEHAQLKHSGGVMDAAYSPDGKHIVTASGDKTARVWDLAGNQIAELKGHQGALLRASFSPDGKQIVTASYDKTARVWDLAGNQIAELKGHQDKVLTASFSPDGKQIVTASDDKTARLWNLSGKQIAQLKGHEGTVVSASFSPDGKRIVTASADKTARVWDLSGKQIAQLNGHEDVVWSVSFSPDGKQIITASGDTTSRVWELSGKQVAQLNGHEGAVWSASFSPDGKRIATASGDKTVRLWDLSGREIIKLKGHQDEVTRVNFSSDGKHIVTASNDRTARVWDLSEKVPLEHEWNSKTALVLSPSSQYVLAIPLGSAAQLWNRSGTLKTVLKGTEQNKEATAAFSADEKYVAMLSSDSENFKMQIWDISGRLIAGFKPDLDEISSISLSPDGQHVITTTLNFDDGYSRAQVWGRSGQKIIQLKGHEDGINSSSFSPNGKHIVTASADRTARVWDLSGRQIAQLDGHQGNVLSAQFSADSRYIITTAGDNTARVWDTSGKQIAELKGHYGDVNSASLSADGQRIVTVSSDRTAKVWDLSGRLIAELRDVDGNFTNAVFSPDGRHIIAALETGKVRAWNSAPLNQLITQGCSWLSDYLKNAPDLSESDRRLCDDVTATAQKSK